MTPDAGAVRGAAGDAALEEKLDLVGRPTSSDDLLEEDAACERAVEDLGEGKLRLAGWRGRRSAISFSGRSSIQPGDVQRLHAPRHDLETLPVGGHLLRGGAIPWQPVPQHLFGILVGGGEVRPPGPPAASLAGEVQHPVDEKAPGPGTRGGRRPSGRPASLLRRALRAALDRVLDVVLQLRKALAGEGEPLPPERLQHLAEQRVRRGGPRGAQNREDRFWPRVQHARGWSGSERSVKTSAASGATS